MIQSILKYLNEVYGKQKKYGFKIIEKDSNLDTDRYLIRFKNAEFKDKSSVEILEKTNWGDLEIGDIVLLYKDDYCPADILILDMWDQKCTVKTSFIDDQSEDTIKYAPLLTTRSSIKGNLLEYRRILSGRIDIKKTDDLSNFRGYLGLKKDPISEKIGSLNLIQKYSQIKYTDWLVGIVVLCGNDSYSYRQSSFEKKEKQRRKPSYFKNKWDIQSIIQILMISFFSLIVIILRISMSCFKSLPFKGQMIPIALDFVLTFPSYCSVINQLGFAFYTIFSNYLFNMSKKDGSQNQSFEFNYLNSFAQLSQNSHVIINSLKIQNQKQKTISTVCLKDRFFKMREGDGQSNSNIRSNTTIIKGKQQSNPTKSEIGDDTSYMNSPLNTFNQKVNSSRLFPNGHYNNYSSRLNEGGTGNLISFDRKKSLTNWNQVCSSNIDDSTSNLQIQHPTLPSSGIGLQLTNFKKQNGSKHSLQQIVEMDSKSFIPQFDNDSQNNELKTDHSIKDRSNSNLHKQSNHQQLQKNNSLFAFDESSNFQTFAENVDLDNSIHSKVGNHTTQKNVSITKLNIECNLSNNHDYNNNTNQTLRKNLDEPDMSYIHTSHRGFMQDIDTQNNKQQNSISQNVSPKSQYGSKRMTSLHTSQNPTHSESKILHNLDSDAITFMKGSFAPVSLHQQVLQNYARSGSQYEQSSTNKLPPAKNQIEMISKNQMVVSFDNISLYDKETLIKQEKQSPLKNIAYQPYFNGSGQSAFFGSSPKWKPQSGTISNNNSETNVSSSQNIQKTLLQNAMNEVLSNNIEQSQQVELQLTVSSASVQFESKNHQIKDMNSDDSGGGNRTPNHTQHLSPYKFKTTQTGQAQRKSLAEDFLEFDLKSSDDEDSIEENLELDEIQNENKINSLDEPSSNNLICNFINSQPLEAYEKIQINSEPNYSQNYQLITQPAEVKLIEDKQKAVFPNKDINSKLKKFNLETNNQDETSPINLKRAQNGQIENLNLLSSEIQGSQLTQPNVQSQVERIFNQISYQQQNLNQMSIIDSQCEYEEQQENIIANNIKQYSGQKMKSFTKQIQGDNLNNFISTQEDGTPQNNNIFYSVDNTTTNQSKSVQNRIHVNPLIQRFKQTITTTNEDFNSAESLQKRLTVSSMLPSTNNIYGKSIEASQRLGSNANLLKRSVPIFENQQGFNKSLSEKSTGARDILFAMALCHETKTKGDRLKNGKNIYNIHLDDDTPFILDFAKKHNFGFECACSIHDQNYYIIKTEEGNEKVLILQKFTSINNRRMIISVQHNNQWYMIIRDSTITIPEYIVNTISSEKKQKLQQLLTRIKKQGEKIIFFSKIFLTEQQQFEFQNQVRLETSQEKIELIYQNFIQSKVDETDSQLQLLGFLGIQEETDMLMKDMIKELKHFGQKIWVLTSDSQSSTLESCYNYKILQDKGMDVLDFSFANFDELFYKTRNHLQVLQKAFQQDGKNNKDNMSTSQLVLNPQQTMKQVSSNAHSTNGYSTPAQLPAVKQPSEQKSTFAEISNRKPLPLLTQQNSQGNINFVKRNTVILGGTSKNTLVLEDDNTGQNITTTEKSELNYYIILSGESLNVIRQYPYLWDHFCLIAFFSNGVIGYEMTDEQKSIICQTISTRFHRSSKKMVNIISSLNDIERLNNDQGSIYISSLSDQHKEDKHMIVSQHADAYAKDSMSFLNLLIRESKLQSEIIEETMYLAIHRSYLTAIIIIFWNIYTCSCNYPLFSPYQQVFFQGLQYLATFFYYVRRKREKFSQDKNNDNSTSRYFYHHFAGYQNQYSPQQIPIMNLKVIISSILDVVLIFLFYTSFYNFENGIEMDADTLANLLQWGVYVVSFCRVFDLHFIKFDRYLLIYIIFYACIMTVETVVNNEEDVTEILMKHAFKNGYVLNTFLFVCYYILKSIMEGVLVNTAPISIIGLSKYIILQKKNAIEDKNKRGQTTNEAKSATKNNNNHNNKANGLNEINGEKKPFDNDFSNRSPDKIGSELKQYDMFSLSKNQSRQTEQVNNNNISMNIQKSEITSFNSFNNPIFSSNMLRNMKKKVNPTKIIRSIFKDKEMDIILSTMLMQEDINLSQTQMEKFTLKFQIKEIEAVFLKGWELLIPYSNRIFYTLHFIVFDIGYDVLVLSKVTNEFSSADGGYVMSYAITASAIFILTALSLSKYYSRKNIVVISAIIVIVRSIKLILLSSFKQIIIYPTECLLHISIACSCLRFSHYNLLLQGLLLFAFLIIITETNVKQWNLQYFLEAIGYTYDGQGGYSESINIIRICFYISYFIILCLYVSEKYNMILTIRKNYLSEHNLFKATLKVKDILSILLPKFIREKIETMKQGQYRVAERQDEVVIVFCDICNFDDIIFNEKTNTVKILDKLYRQFDLACQQNGLQKIETVGKTYLAAAGISDVENLLKAEGRLQDVSPAKRALTFAFEMQKIVKSKALYLSSNKKIIIKVGIHLGPAISGVIGYHKPQFSLIGDTVNTTSRVCSTGLSDHIIISNEVYNKVHQQNSQYKFQQRDVEAKGKGIMITYQVYDKKSLRQTNVVKKQTYSFLDDTALLTHNNNNNSSKAFYNLLSSQNQFGYITNASTTQNMLENSEKSDKLLSDAIIHSNDLTVMKKVNNNNSKQFIKLKSIPESPTGVTNTTHITNFNLIESKDEVITSQKTAQLIPSSDKSLSKDKNQSFQNLRQKQTSFGGAVDAITSKPIVNKVGGDTPLKRTRMLKKSSSMTVVDVKPRFTNDSSGKIKGSGKEDGLDDIISSPLMASKNEFIKQMEKDLLMRIELEPEQIYLKELNLPLEKIQMHISHQDHGGGDKSLASQEIGNSQSSNLRIGICSTSGKTTAEQKKLHTEFLKSNLKQQVQSVTIWLLVISIYFLVKLIIIINFTNNKNPNIVMDNNNQLLLTVFSASIFIIFFAIALSFQRLHSYLSWGKLRLFLYSVYFLTLLFVSLSDSELDTFLKSIKNYNINLMNQTPNHSQNIILDAVTQVTYPSIVIYCLEIQFIFMFFTTFKSLNFLEKVGAYGSQIIFYFIYSSVKEELDSLMLFFLFILGLVHLRIQYHHMQNEVRNFNNLKTLEIKKDELDSLLKNLLPSHILEQFLNSMKKEIPLVCEELDDVTLLFADIAGFTKYSSTTDPIVVVNMLRKLFTDFDDQCLNQNVYKLYTIGDCYVCFGLNNKNDRNPAQEAHNVIRFAFDMIRIIENVRQYTNCNLQMRIGVHTGKLYGGIVGTEIVRYDIYGQDVIIANKMESNGESGHVMVSETTKKLLEDHYPSEFIYDFKESVHIKQANTDIDGFLIRFNQNTSVYLENPVEQ